MDPGAYKRHGYNTPDNSPPLAAVLSRRFSGILLCIMAQSVALSARWGVGSLRVTIMQDVLTVAWTLYTSEQSFVSFVL